MCIKRFEKAKIEMHQEHRQGQKTGETPAERLLFLCDFLFHLIQCDEL